MLRIKMPDGPSGPAPMPEAEAVAPVEEDVDLPVDEPIDDVAMSPMGSVDPLVARYLGPEAMCQACIHFLEPDACEIVAGPINPEGVCSLFTPDGEDLEEPDDEEEEVVA